MVARARNCSKGKGEGCNLNGGNRIMKAVVFRGKEDLRVEEVPEPKILEQTDIIVKVTLSTI